MSRFICLAPTCILAFVFGIIVHFRYSMDEGYVAGRAYLCEVCGYKKVSVSFCSTTQCVQSLSHEIGHK